MMEWIDISNGRENKYDVIKGILICCVVLGHSSVDIVHDIIFLFHMPLFLIISGVLVDREKVISNKYVCKKVRYFLVPYFCYLIIDLFLIQRSHSIWTFVRAFYGGRAISGVYWYVTCFLFALFLLSVLIRNFSDKMSKTLILTGGGYSSNRITPCG